MLDEHSSTCLECGHSEFRTLEERIKGWVGIQRFDDNNRFGSTLSGTAARFGSPRRTRSSTSPDDLEAVKEYPTDQQTGRIVGRSPSRPRARRFSEAGLPAQQRRVAASDAVPSRRLAAPEQMACGERQRNTRSRSSFRVIGRSGTPAARTCTWVGRRARRQGSAYRPRGRGRDVRAFHQPRGGLLRRRPLVGARRDREASPRCSAGGVPGVWLPEPAGRRRMWGLWSASSKSKDCIACGTDRQVGGCLPGLRRIANSRCPASPGDVLSAATPTGSTMNVWHVWPL